MSPQRVQLLIQLQHEETSHDALRRHLGVDGATVTRLVKELENDGFVTRRPDPDDNRYTLAALTPAGEEFTAQLGSRHQKYLEGLLQGVSAEDRELTLLVLAHVRNNLELEST
jgi:DNA-binding MarR family transcriptional regulator